MKKTIGTLLAMVLVLGMVFVVESAMAANNDNQNVKFNVLALNNLDLTAGDVQLPDLTPSTGTVSVSTQSTYSITTNSSTAQRIIAKIDSVMPQNLKLKLALAAPGSGNSTGAKEISPSDQELVTGVTIASGTYGIDYTLESNGLVGQQNNTVKTLTITITP